MWLTKHVKGPWQSSICYCKSEGTVGLEAGKGPSILARIPLPTAECSAESWLILNISFQLLEEEHGKQTGGDSLTLPAWWSLSHQHALRLLS